MACRSDRPKHEDVNRFEFWGKKIRIPTRGWAVQRARSGRQKMGSTLLSGQPRRWRIKMKLIQLLALLIISNTSIAGTPRPPLPWLCEYSDIIVLAEMVGTNTMVTYLKGIASSNNTETITDMMRRDFTHSTFDRAYAFFKRKQSVANGISSRVLEKSDVVPVINSHVTFYGAPEDWHGSAITGNNTKRWEYDEATFRDKLLKYIDQAANKAVKVQNPAAGF